MHIIKKLFLGVLSIVSFSPAIAQWQPAGNRIATEWKAEVNPENAWKEYPRPQLVRNKWMNLNGLWQYAIVSKGEE